MRFAVFPICLFLNVAALTAMAEEMAGVSIGAGLRATAQSEGVMGYARMTLDAPLTGSLGLRGRLDIGEAEVGGLPDIDFGAGLQLDGEDWSVFADLRYGSGTGGAAAVTGIDLLARSGSLTLEAGPRLSLWGEGYSDASGEDMPEDTFAGASPGPEQRGFLTAGLHLSARYDLGADWGLEGDLQVDSFLGRPNDSGATTGTPARLSASIMATHRFQLEF